MFLKLTMTHIQHFYNVNVYRYINLDSYIHLLDVGLKVSIFFSGRMWKKQKQLEILKCKYCKNSVKGCGLEIYNKFKL